MEGLKGEEDLRRSEWATCVAKISVYRRGWGIVIGTKQETRATGAR